jgi:hypothetical protein
VRNTGTKKEGIVFILRGTRKPSLVGAGMPFGNGGDDFSWLDLWNVEDRGARQQSRHEKASRRVADRLMVAKEGAASALIYLKNGEPKWQQQGD